MGLHPSVKQYLKKQSSIWLKDEELDASMKEIRVVIEDWMLVIRGGVLWGNNYDTTFFTVRDHLRNIMHQNPSCNTYIAVFDDNSNVPVCKSIVHNFRTSKVLKIHKEFTEQEIETLKLKSNLRGFLRESKSFRIDIERCLNTRSLRNHLIEEICHLINKLEVRDFKEGFKIIIDKAATKDKEGYTLFSQIAVKDVDSDNLTKWEFSNKEGNTHGEGDLKIPFWVSRQEKGEKVLVISKDTDTILTLGFFEASQRKRLKSVQEHINTKLDLSFSKYKEVLDIRSMFLHIKKTFWKQDSSVIVFLVLCAVCGGDYSRIVPRNGELVGLPFVNFEHFVSAMLNLPNLNEFIYARSRQNSNFDLIITIEKSALAYLIIYVYLNIRDSSHGFKALENQNTDIKPILKDFKIFENSIQSRSKVGKSLVLARDTSNVVPTVGIIKGYLCRVSWSCRMYCSWEQTVPDCLEKKNGFTLHGWEIKEEDQKLFISDNVFWD